MRPRTNIPDNPLKYQKILYRVLYTGLFVTFLQFFVDFGQAFSNLTTLMLLWCATAFLSHLLLVFVILMLLLSVVQYTIVLGMIIQVYLVADKYLITNKRNTITYSLILVIVILYDIIAIRASFVAYRVFKYNFTSLTGSNRFHNIGSRHTDVDETNQLLPTRNDEESGRRRFEPFRGHGIRIN